MPQSITLSNDYIGKMELEKSKKIYNTHKKLSIIARDKKSYNYAKDIFDNNDIYLAPDSVIYLENYYEKFKKLKRENIIFTFRKDKEKILSSSKINEIKEILNKKRIKYLEEDTIVDYNIQKNQRETEVENILYKISKSKLNITDRFHGVIFSVITNTPVIALKSLDHKIKEGMKWFDFLDWVHYVTEDDDLEKIILKYIDSDYKIDKEKYFLKEKLEKVFNRI